MIRQLAGTKSSILGLNCCGIVIADNELHPLKQSSPMTLTDDGIDRDREKKRRGEARREEGRRGGGGKK